MTSNRKIERLFPMRLLALAFLLAIVTAAPGRLAATQSAASSASKPLAVTDEMGRTVRVPQPVRRIVSLAPNLTETVFAIGAGDLLVGDTDYCDYPAEALKKTRVGGPVNPSLEKIAALHPDLVLATPTINRLVTVQSLEQLGISVYVTDPRTVNDILSSTETLGRLLGSSDKSAALVASLRGRVQQLRERLSGTEPKSVFFVTWTEPLISVGGNTFLADALRLAGARSVITTSQDWPTVNLERVVSSQPEYLVFSSDEPDRVHQQIAELRHRPGWSDLEAIERDRVIILGEEFSRPAPRLLDSIEQLARALHADRFATEGSASPVPARPTFSAGVGAL
jgi:iron complex transport system substrate-binding protein